MNFSKAIFFALATLMVVSCGNNNGTTQSTKKKYTKQEIEDYNRLMAKKEAKRISQYVEEKGWPAKETGTGLHYYIYEDSSGPKPVEGNKVKVNITICYLNGDTAYSHVRYGAETFEIDRTNKESGLNEGVQYMPLGAKAKLVIPSHLAHGVVGDQAKIPPRTPLVFDVELLEIF
ncbi:FKBP-type peptidyl-prolyl cis-trans isomerase [Luteibaculum oceani]|nr:FKBP-type peptidyl-prolyl cis-trans isomerase [Luteibaculum oceani]